MLAKNLIKSISIKLLTAAHLLFGKIIKKNNSLVFISYPEASDNPRALFEEIKRHQLDYTLIWLAKDVGALVSKLNSNTVSQKNVKVIKKYSLKGYLSLLRARHVFFSHGHYDFVKASGERKFINLWHGMPIKSIGLLDREVLPVSQSSDIVIAENDYFAPIMGKAFGLPEAAVWTTGQPRCADLLINEEEQSTIKRIIGIDKNFAIFMPTYKKSIVGDVRNDGAYQEDDKYKAEFETILNQIQLAAFETGFQVLVKIHPMDVLNKYTFKGNRELIFYNQVHSIDKISLYKILGSSDTLITDLSSVAIDFMVTRKSLYMAWPSDNQYTRKIVIDKSYFESNNCVAEDYSLIQQHFESVKQAILMKNIGLNTFASQVLTPSEQIMKRLGLLE